MKQIHRHQFLKRSAILGASLAAVPIRSGWAENSLADKIGCADALGRITLLRVR